MFISFPFPPPPPAVGSGHENLRWSGMGFLVCNPCFVVVKLELSSIQ